MTLETKNSLKGHISAPQLIKGKLNTSIIKEYPELEDIEIVPMLSEQRFKAKKYGYDNITVKAVETEELNVKSSDIEQVFNGIYSPVKVKPIEPEDIIIQPSKEQQEYTSTKDGYKKVTVNKIETEKIEINPSEQTQSFEGLFDDIKVNGIQTQNLNVQLDFSNTNEMDLSPEENKYYKNVKISKNENLIPENIKKDVTIDGVIGTLEASGGVGFTGHVDAEGLKQIGWTDEDINYFQQNGVTWNEEDDYLFKLTPEELAGNVSNTTRFLPKNTTILSFSGYKWLTALPIINLSISRAYEMFRECNSLKFIPLINIENIIETSYMFYNCYSLLTIPRINTSNVSIMSYMFQNCYSLLTIPQLDTSNTSTMTYIFANNYNIINVPKLDAFKCTNVSAMFLNCFNLKYFGGLKNLGQAYITSRSENYSSYKLDLSTCIKLTHDSLMNVINNLYNIKSKGCRKQALVLGTTNLAKLTTEEIAIATNKGWNVS